MSSILLHRFQVLIQSISESPSEISGKSRLNLGLSAYEKIGAQSRQTKVCIR